MSIEKDDCVIILTKGLYVKMGIYMDLTGWSFGKLTVLYQVADYVSPKGVHMIRWRCRCECGNECDVTTSALRHGNVRSCGCSRKKLMRGAYVADLTGQVFGKLTALYRTTDYMSRSGKTKAVRWHCLCECGNEVDVVANALVSGKTQSCGCYRRERVSSFCLDDLTGRVFGRLTVLHRVADYVSPAGSHTTKYHCKCECGNEIDVRSNCLKSGHTTSCGCAHNRDYRDLTGQQFGRLFVMGRSDDDYVAPSGRRVLKWHCKCECGNEIDVRADLFNRGQMSCGCLQSGLEYMVIQYLNLCGTKYDTHKTYDDLVGTRCGKLSYDFLVYRDRQPYCFIECQGQQHYHSVEYFGGDEKFEIQQEHDRRKREYAEQLGIPLIEIPYTADTYEKVAVILQASGI